MIKTSSPNNRLLSLKNLSFDSELLDYLVQSNIQPGERIPPLGELSEILHVSVSKLREQLEVARCLGLVTVRPRTGIHRQEYDFMPAVRLGVFFALANNILLFDAYSELRRHLEVAYWHDAVTLLTYEDRLHLRHLVNQAWDKLRGNPIRIPHPEHREFHLTIFSRYANVFVRGLLETYWEAYEAVQLHTFLDYEYLNQVWQYHEQIAEAVIAGDIDGSLQAYMDHTKLLKNFAERQNTQDNGK
jgi:DNA-binding FadR family transcriptional regulator